ncbi:MAG: NFYB/HAP3 family transcription factor subunit [Candidatus Woesearchaeota archaeon]|nr:NFYB/HAP3 family transcription factor subunit [Candidatus Woesearchaeota archaeon]
MRENILPYETIGKIMEEATSFRISHDAKIAVAEHLEAMSLEIGKLASRYASHRGKNTMTAKDIELAYKTYKNK